MVENKIKGLTTHFIYAGQHYHRYESRLRSLILKKMKNYKMNSVMVTILDMARNNFIGKEAAERISLYNEVVARRIPFPKPPKMAFKGSVTDDLESFCNDLKVGKMTKDEAWTYFLPKLMENEFELVGKDSRKGSNEEDKSKCRSWNITCSRYLYHGPIIMITFRMKNEDLKYMEAFCCRRTFTIQFIASKP